MKYLKLFITLYCFVACTDYNTDQFVGKWHLSESLVDIGDGKATFKKASSSQTIEFFSDGKVTTDGSFCIGENTNEAIYFIDTKTIVSKACKKEVGKISFELNGEELILNFPCIEQCSFKYLRAK